MNPSKPSKFAHVRTVSEWFGPQRTSLAARTEIPLQASPCPARFGDQSNVPTTPVPFFRRKARMTSRNTAAALHRTARLAIHPGLLRPAPNSRRFGVAGPLKVRTSSDSRESLLPRATRPLVFTGDLKTPDKKGPSTSRLCVGRSQTCRRPWRWSRVVRFPSRRTFPFAA